MVDLDSQYLPADDGRLGCEMAGEEGDEAG